MLAKFDLDTAENGPQKSLEIGDITKAQMTMKSERKYKAQSPK